MGFIRQAVLFQFVDQVQHLRNILGRTRLMVRSLNAKRIGVFVHEADKAIGQLTDRFAVFLGAPDDLVVDIGDVAHVGQIKTACAQPALNHVKNDQHTSVAKVAVVIDGHAADVHANLAGFDGDKLLLFPHKGVIDFQHFRLTRALRESLGAQGKLGNRRASC